MAQKLLVVLLVVVAVVFVVTIALGSSHGPRSPDDSDPDGIGFLDGLQGNHFLRIGDRASTDCPTVSTDPTVLSVPTSGCALVVEKRGFFSRPTRVAFDVAGQVVVNATTNGVTTKPSTVPDGDHRCYASAVDHSGGTISLSAFFATTITLRTAACPKS